MNSVEKSQVGHSADADNVEDALDAGNYRQAIIDSQGATAKAMENTLLTPRFYTTDFDELDAVDVSPVREDWDQLIERMKSDPKFNFKVDMTQIDAVAASIILEDFLKTRRDNQN